MLVSGGLTYANIRTLRSLDRFPLMPYVSLLSCMMLHGGQAAEGSDVDLPALRLSARCIRAAFTSCQPSGSDSSESALPR